MNRESHDSNCANRRLRQYVREKERKSKRQFFFGKIKSNFLHDTYLSITFLSSLHRKQERFFTFLIYDMHVENISAQNTERKKQNHKSNTHENNKYLTIKLYKPNVAGAM